MTASGQLIIRDAEPQEREVVVELTRLAYAEFQSVMTPTAWRGLSNAVDDVLANSGPAEIIVATDGHRIIGSVFLYPGGSSPYPDGKPLQEPEVRLLSIEPAQRGRGVGRALVNECIRRAKEANASEIGLHTSASFRAAIALYRSMGFERVPERDFTPPGAEVVEGYRLVL